MEYFTEPTEPKQKAIKILLDHGFRVMHSGEPAVLMKPNHVTTIHIAQVTNDGTVNTIPLSEFLDKILS